MRESYLTFLLLAILNLNPNMLTAQWVKANGSIDSANCIISFNANLFIGTNYDIFRSTDEGKTWYPFNSGLSNLDVRTFTFTPTTLFAGTAGGIFSSTDNGTSWTAANSGLNTFDIRALTVLALDGGTHLYAGVYGGGVYRSTDNGENWHFIYSGLHSFGVVAIVVTYTDIFVGSDESGIDRSTDNGTTWFPANSGLTNLDVRAITLSGTNIFTGTAGGVFRSSNNGTTWIPVNSGLTNLDIRTLIAKGTDLFALTTSGEIFRSTDNGTTWISVLTDYKANAISVSNTDLLAATNFGVYRYADNGTSWTEVNFNFLTPNSIYIPSDFAVLNNNFFAGCAGGVIVRSTDNGTNWIKDNTGLPNDGVGIVSLAVLDTIIFVGMYSYGAGYGVFRSTDKGLSWIPVNSGLSNLRVYALYVSEEDLFAGTDGDGVFLSTDYGDSWTNVSEGLWYPQIITSFASIGTNLFAGSMWPYGGGGVYRSTNKGTNWTAVSYGLTSYAVSDLAVSGTNLFAGTQGAYLSDSSGIFCSTNNGANWDLVGLENLNLFALACIDNYIFAGTFNDGIFLSTNNGTSWVPFNEGIDDNTSIVSIAIKDSNVFISTYRSGPWVVCRRPLSDIITSVAQAIDPLPINYFLSQNYPNPFNPSTKITYSLPNTGMVQIKVFDLLGQEIATLVNEEKPVGTYEVNWNAANLPSGVYFYRIQAGSFVQTRKMILLK
jgi:photosystem II stability/assembly factor-like uncharacterized protein